MNIKPVCVCVTTARKKQKKQSLFDKFSYSFNTYTYLMLSQLSHPAWHKDDLARSMSTRKVILKQTNWCLVGTS